MAEVTGTIGNENVILDNAATEATLRQLLQATIAAGTKNTKALEDMAKSSGMNPDTIKKVNTELTDQAPKLKKVNVELTEGQVKLLEFGKKLVDGTAQTSDLFSAFSLLPGVLGTVAKGLSLIASYQEKNFETYQKITNAGVNFGGSLTDLRLAAANSYLTLDQFANLMKNNGKTFASMGTTANDGAKAFANLSNNIIKSDLGTKLGALGYSFEEMNTGTLNYIAATGGRTQSEMKNTKALADASASYLEELDKLAQFTGASRSQMEEEAKKAALKLVSKRKETPEEKRERFLSALEGPGSSSNQKPSMKVVKEQVPSEQDSAKVGQMAQQASDSGKIENIINRDKDSRAVGELANQKVEPRQTVQTGQKSLSNPSERPGVVPRTTLNHPKFRPVR